MQHVVLEDFRIQMQLQVVSGFVECGVFLVKTPGLVPGDRIEEWGQFAHKCALARDA
jgi:hypothetical protein